MLALGALSKRRGNWTTHLDIGRKVVAACYEAYERSSTGLGSEHIYLATLEAVDRESYYLRPELVESIFYMWRFTHDPIYRVWGWNIAQSIERQCRDSVGFHGLISSNEFNDRQESYFLAETLKYLYLLFSADDLVPLDKYVFNTEGHPFSIRGHGPRTDMRPNHLSIEYSDAMIAKGEKSVNGANQWMDTVIQGALRDG